MGRMYSVRMLATSVSAAKDLMRITGAAAKVFLLHEVKVSQELSETSEQLPIVIQRASTDGTGTAETPVVLNPGDVAFGGTAAVNLTVDTTAGDILWREAQNVLNGWHYLPTPETRLVIGGGARVVVRLPTAPAAALTLSVIAIIEELG